MSLRARRELLESTAPRYRKASKAEKGGILDEFAAATGYHRKYAIALLGRDPRKPAGRRPSRGPRPGRRSRRCTPEVRASLERVWKAANRICSKRLVPFLPQLVAALERHGHLALTDEVRRTLLTLSPATVDRCLSDVRKRERRRGIGTTRPGSLLKHQIPVRTFADWDDVRPGFTEADLVAHCGGDPGGHFLHSLVITDVATGWTECQALLFRDQEMVVSAVTDARRRLPFPLLGFDSDNGSEFLNYVVFDYLERESITFTRSRPYKKNDQCHVEQKNGSVVRRLVGYDRYEGIAPCRVLAELYEALSLYLNYFQPSLKLLSKERRGSRVVKRYDEARTPCERVLASEHVSTDVKRTLRRQYDVLDPVTLLESLEALQDRLWRYAHVRVGVRQSPGRRAREPRQPAQMETKPPVEAGQGGAYAARTPAASTGGTSAGPRMYRRTKKPRKKVTDRWWRTRADPFVDVWDDIRNQLEGDPYIPGTAVLSELQRRYPGRFTRRQLRTLQRRLKAWRVAQAKNAPSEAGSATARVGGLDNPSHRPEALRGESGRAPGLLHQGNVCAQDSDDRAPAAP